jgi:hypothetical protein
MLMKVLAIAGSDEHIYILSGGLHKVRVSFTLMIMVGLPPPRMMKENRGARCAVV